MLKARPGGWSKGDGNYTTISFRGAPGEIAAYDVYIKTPRFEEVRYCQAYNTAT